MKRYVLTNYTVQCTDQISGKKGCFIFDLGRYQDTGLFYAITPVYKDLVDLYDHTDPSERKPCYIEYNGK